MVDSTKEQDYLLQHRVDADLDRARKNFREFKAVPGPGEEWRRAEIAMARELEIRRAFGHRKRPPSLTVVSPSSK